MGSTNSSAIHCFTSLFLYISKTFLHILSSPVPLSRTTLVYTACDTLALDGPIARRASLHQLSPLHLASAYLRHPLRSPPPSIMPIREKAKRIFKRSKSDALSKTDSNSSRERWPSNVYKPGEPMPRPKYRAAPKKEHTEKLEAFSFADAWRKKSFQSTYSPMGTRAPSRRASLFSRKSISGKSTSGRTASVVSNGTTRSGPNANRMETQQEAEGDDDVTNGECDAPGEAAAGVRH